MSWVVLSFILITLILDKVNSTCFGTSRFVLFPVEIAAEFFSDSIRFEYGACKCEKEPEKIESESATQLVSFQSWICPSFRHATFDFG